MDTFAKRLIGWFDAHGRHDLPWQLDATPYSIWVSEIMLQQTQVATVIPYFERFMRRFPRVQDLAAAELDEVLALWSGLGYYARARNLHHAARRIVEDFGGEMPRRLEALMELPGIGRSTAGAIVALAHGLRAPILDGNVKRVLARFHGIEGWSGQVAVARELWRQAEAHTPTAEIAAYTQAIMDLGATLCARSKPACGRCPLAGDCVAAREERHQELPSPRPRRERPRRSVRMLLVRDAERRLLLERRPPSGIWGGLYSLPEIGEDEEPPAWCARVLRARIVGHRVLPDVDHAFTHFDLRITPTLLDLESTAAAAMERPDWVWYNAAMRTSLGLAAPIAALLESLESPELGR